MGIFSLNFGTAGKDNTQQSKVNWLPMCDLKQLDEAIEASFHQPVVIFKHSTRCGISRMVLKQFESEWTSGDKIVPYFLDLLEHRPISNAIAERFDVLHQSPQLLLIAEGKCIYNASHSAIEAAVLPLKI